MSSLLRRQLGATALGLQLTLIAPSIRAQIPVTSPAEPEQLTPPTLVESAEAPYPEDAKAQGLEATVALRLSIDEQGVVTDVDVVESAGHGFDEAAREAALKFRFVPARRGDQAIAARIRYAYVFKMPEQAPLATDAAPPVLAPARATPAPAATSSDLPAGAPVPSSPTTLGPETATASAVDVNVRGQLSEGQRLQQSAEAVNVVDLRRAREQSADLGEVLARNQGVVVRREGGLGSGERFSLNGLYDEQIRFFLDGIPLDLAGYTFGVASMPVNLVQRVEIYRGVVPIRFGADALGGAVNLVSDQDYATHASGSYQVGSFGTQRATLSGRYRHVPSGFVAGATAFLDVAKNDYDVDVQVPDERGRLSPARVPRFHDSYRAAGGNVEAGVVDRPWAKRLVLRGFYASLGKQLQHNVVMTVPYGGVHYDSSVYGATGRYEVDLPHDVQVEVVGAYSKRTTHFEDHSFWVYNWYGERVRQRRVAGEIESKPTDQLSWQHSGFGRIGVRWQPRPGHAFSLSSSPNYTTRTGDERLQADPTARDPLNADRKLTTLVSGLEYQVDLFGDRLSNVLFAKDYVYHAKSEEPISGGGLKKRDVNSHRAGVGDALRFRFTPWLYAKASYEFATRLPGPDEIFGDGVLVHANLDLQPEISHNANLGPRLELTRTPAGDFVAEINAFWRDSERLVVLLGNDRYFTYQNVYRARARGLENMVGWTSPHRYVSVEGGLTWLDLRNASSEGTFGDFEGDRIPNRPYLTGSWGARLRFTGFPDKDDTLEPYYNGRYVHAFYRGWESQGLKEFKQVVDAQVVHSGGVTWSLSEGFGHVTTSAEIDNMTSAKAFDNFGVERPGRAFYLKLAAEI